MTRVVLASASSGRRRVLRGAGIDPLIIVSGVDEDALVASLPDDAGPDIVTTSLATAKAEAVVRTLSAELADDCVLIGCDSMLHSNGDLVGKPDSVAAVLGRWHQMAGGAGELVTGHCLVRLRDGDVVYQTTDFSRTTVIFGTPSSTELDAYIRSGEPFKVAGAFTLDGLGGWFVEAVQGDPSGVIGISLPLTRRLLLDAGLSIADLWEANSPG